MSGIAGLFRLDGAPVAPGLVEAMAESMAHRGPDGIHCWSRASVALGHCMLRTTPESLEEIQPLANEDESVGLAMDGRIDNWKELRAELTARGARLRDRSDAELVLRAYETWGRDCLDRIDGDFALIIWDGRRREAFCARDRMGHKPFHYYWDGRCLAVASELHAILALPWVEETLNEGMIAEHLAFDVYSLDETLWEGVQRLPPAHRMVVGAAGLRVEKYWAPDLAVELRYRHEREYVEHYRALLEDVVRRQSRASGPLACEVSGGLDSSAVFAVGEMLRSRGELLAPAIDAYTLRFEDGAAGRDLPHARAVGAHLGCPVHEIAPAEKPLQWYCDWADRYRDMPSAPHGTMHLGIHQAARRRGSRVLLGGFGGDQWLKGDHSYLAGHLAAGHFGALLGCLRRDARVYGLRPSLYLVARHGVFPLLPPDLRRGIHQALAHLRGRTVDTPYWLGDSLAAVLRERRNGRPGSGHERARPVHRRGLRLLDSAQNLFAHEWTERLAASAALEMRAPLDSAALVQFAFSVPQEWLLKNGWNRYIHRKALEGILPGSVAWRRGEAEFSVVFKGYRTELSETMSQAISSSPKSWLSRDGFDSLLQGAREDRTVDMIRLWMFFACNSVREASKEPTRFWAEARAS